MRRFICWAIFTPKRWGPAIGTVAILAVLGSCTSPSGDTPAESSVPEATVGPGSPAPVESPGTREPVEDSVPTTQPPPKAGLVTVPDVSGMDHQTAQDAMQDAGLYYLREVDGKGLGRLLLNDRNWVQTGQSPAPGTEVPTDAVITLTAVKTSD